MRRESARLLRVAAPLLLAAATACSLYHRVIPTRPPPGVDLNHATTDEIAALPGLDEADAERIVQSRPYDSKDALLRRGVVTPEQFHAFADRVYIGRSGDATRD